MIHSIFQIVLGYLLWKHIPAWLRLNNSQTVDHYIIIGLSLVGILMVIMGGLHVIEYLL